MSRTHLISNRLSNWLWLLLMIITSPIAAEDNPSNLDRLAQAVEHAVVTGQLRVLDQYVVDQSCFRQSAAWPLSGPDVISSEAEAITQGLKWSLEAALNVERQFADMHRRFVTQFGSDTDSVRMHRCAESPSGSIGFAFRRDADGPDAACLIICPGVMRRNGNEYRLAGRMAWAIMPEQAFIALSQWHAGRRPATDKAILRSMLGSRITIDTLRKLTGRAGLISPWTHHSGEPSLAITLPDQLLENRIDSLILHSPDSAFGDAILQETSENSNLFTGEIAWTFGGLLAVMTEIPKQEVEIQLVSPSVSQADYPDRMQAIAFGQPRDFVWDLHGVRKYAASRRAVYALPPLVQGDQEIRVELIDEEIVSRAWVGNQVIEAPAAETMTD